jgi:hypothetical protein
MHSPLVKTVTEVRSDTSGASPVTVTAPSAAADESPWSLELWFRLFGIGAGMGFFMSFVGAFGTNEAPFLRRLGYWELVMIGGSLIAVGTNIALRNHLMKRSTVLAQEIAGVILVTLMITGFVWLVSPTYWGHDWSASIIPTLTGIVFVITLIMTFLHYVLERKPLRSHAFVVPTGHALTHEVMAGASEVAFYNRLPPKFRDASIRALSSEDHYLRVHTDRGEALILMRLYDAIREIEGIEGSQTHRSWWVAKDAIIEVVRKEGRPAFRVEGGLSVPISRTYQKALKDEAWL